MKVLMSGGGTAGHVYPALAVAALLRSQGDEVVYVGTPTGPEARLVLEAGIAFHALKAAGFDRSRPWTLVTSSLTLAVSTLRAWSLLRRERPDVVVGFGGYVSIPVGVAARLARVPLVIHEQNSVPGLANAVLSRWATAVALTYAEAADRFDRAESVEVTGNPVRPAVLEASRAQGRARLDVAPEDTMLLVFGGSRGARHINAAMAAAAARLIQAPDVHVVHVAGAAEYETVRSALAAVGVEGHPRYRLHAYIDEMGDAMCAADLVVSRAGATSIAELTAVGVAAVLVPFPFATDDHQTKNARACVEAGAAVLVEDSRLDSGEFADTVAGLLRDPARRATMAVASRALGRRDAADRVVSVIRSAARSSTPR